jgi:hypothetical protein
MVTGLRKSELSKVVFSSIAPVRNPLPRVAEGDEADPEFLERRQEVVVAYEAIGRRKYRVQVRPRSSAG